MKQLLILIGLFCSVWASAQTPPGYVRINQRAHQYAEAADMMNLPAGTTAAFGAGQWRRSGAVFVDTTGADAGVYYSIGTTWIKIFDETDAVGATLSNIGTGFDLAQYGTSNVKRLAFANGLVGDSATSQTVTARLGGTLVSNTTIAAGNRRLNFTWDSLQTSTGGLYLSSTSSVNGLKRILGVNHTQTTTASSGLAEGIVVTLSRLETGTPLGNNAIRVTDVSGGYQNTAISATSGHGLGASAGTSYGISVGAATTGTITGRYGAGPLVGGYFLGNGSGRGSVTGWYGTSTYGIQAQANLSHTSASADSAFTATAGDFTTFTNGSGTAIGAQITSTYNSGIGGTPKLYGLIVRGATTEKPLSGFLATSNTPNSIVHIGPAAAGYGSLMIEETTTVPTSPVDGMMWHYADSLYFRSGGVTYNLTHLNEGGGDTDDQTFQETLDESSTLNKANTIDQDGFLMQWLGPNRFYDSSATQVSIRDFNSGTDYTWYTPILGDTVGNVQMNVADGFKVSMTDGAETHSLQVNGNGIFAEGLKYEDNDALRAVVIDTLTGEIRTAALGAVSGIDDVLAVGQSLSATRTINLNGNPLSISNGFDANSFSPTSFSSQYFESGFTHSTTLTNYKDYFQALTASSGNTSQALIETHKDYYARMYVTTPSATSYARVDDDQIELNTTNLKFTGRVFNDAPSLRGLALDTTNGYVYTVPIGSGSSVSFGSDNQIPYTNSGGTDFDYSSGFTFDGTTLGLPQDINFNGGSYYLSSYAGGTRLSLQGGTGSGSQTTFKLLSPDATDSLLARADNGGGHLIDRSGDLTIRRSNTTQLTFGTSTITSAISFLPRTGATGAGSAPIKYTSGTLMTTAEAGAQEYNGDHFLTKANNVRYAVGGSLHNNVTSVAVTGSSAENLMSYTLPAGALSTNGSYIEVTAVFYCVTVGENFKIAFGSTNVVDFTVGSVGTYYVTGTITRTGATTQEARFNVGGAESAALITSPTETLSNAIVVKGVGEGIGAGDITQFQLNVKYYGN
jgi:hypothetical protein